MVGVFDKWLIRNLIRFSWNKVLTYSDFFNYWYNPPRSLNLNVEIIFSIFRMTSPSMRLSLETIPHARTGCDQRDEMPSMHGHMASSGRNRLWNWEEQKTLFFCFRPQELPFLCFPCRFASSGAPFKRSGKSDRLPGGGVLMRKLD